MSADSAQRELDEFWKKSVRLAHAVALAGAALLYLLGGRALALGLLLGALVSVLRFRLRYRAMLRGSSASGLVRLRLFAYVLSGATLAAAFYLHEVFSPWTTAAGLLVMNASLIAVEVLSRDSGRRAGTPVEP